MAFYDKDLAPHTIDVPLYAGQNSSADPKIIDVGSLPLVENGRYYTNGQNQKRFGVTRLGNRKFSGQGFAQGKQVLSSNNALFEFDGNDLFNYNTPNSNWQPIGALNSGKVRSISLTQSVNNVDELSSAASNTAVCLAWAENGQIKISIYNPNNGSYIQSGTVISPAGKSPIVAVEPSTGNFYVSYIDTLLNVVNIRQIPASNLGGLGIAVTVPLSLSLQSRYDMVINNSDELYVLGDNGNGGSNCNYARYDRNFNFQGVGLTLGVAAPGTNVSLIVLNTGVLASASSGWEYLNPDPTGEAGSWDVSGTVRRAVGAVKGIDPTNTFYTGTIFLEVEQNFGTTTQIYIRPQSYIHIVSPTDGTTITDSGTPWFTNQNSHLASRAFNADGFVYAWVLSDFKFQTQLELIDSEGRPVGRAQTNGAAAPYDRVGISIPSVLPTSGGNYYFANRRRSAITFDSTGSIVSTIGGALLDLDYEDSTAQVQAVYLNGTTYFAGAAPKLYDGSTLSEVGFWFYPDTPTTTVTTGGQLSAGTYSYAIAYFWTDNSGKEWFSPVILGPPGSTQPSGSSGVSVVVTDGAAVTLANITYLQGSDKKNVRIGIYRTPVNGTQYFLIANIPNVDILGLLSTSYTDGAPDTSLNGQLLYTDGSQPPYLAPPGISYLTASPNQLYALVSETQEVWVSGITGQNVPPQYVQGQTIGVPLLEQPPVGVMVMDGLLYITGPNDWLTTNATGQLNSLTPTVFQFAPPVKLPFDSGCVSAQSLLLSEDGIYYQSKKGIQLLSRSQQTNFIGESVKNFPGQVLGVAQITNQQQIRFLMASQTLVFDYVFKRWSIYTYRQSPSLNNAVVSCCAWLDDWVHLESNGNAQQEIAGIFTDNGQFIKRNIELPWIKPSGLNGYARCWEFVILGESKSVTSLNVSIAYQYDPTYIDKLRIDGNQVNPNSVYGVNLGGYGNTTQGQYGSNVPGRAFQFQGTMPRQKATSFKFLISDVESDGEAVALNVLSLTVGLYNGLARLPAGKRVG